MNFDRCAHGNIGLTCPQCRGRQPSAPAAPVSGFGLPARAGVPPQAQASVPEDDSIESLFDRLKSADQKFNVLVGSSLEKLVERSEEKVEATARRDVRQHNAFWRQINEPTTVSEHEELRKESGGLPGNA